MAIKILNKSEKVSIKKLQEEVGFLRSYIIGQIGKDSEGEYKPGFVEKILKASKEKPKYEFKDPDSFLKHIQSK